MCIWQQVGRAVVRDLRVIDGATQGVAPARSELAVRTPMRQIDRWTVLAALAVAHLATAAQGQSPFPTSAPPEVQSAFPPVHAQPAATPSHSAARSAPAATQQPPLAYSSECLFKIEYKWDSGSKVTDAAAVKLFLSQDRGASWSEIVSDAKPEVQFFQYHAPSDGEYLFAMQTIDTKGQPWPAGPPQGELRVVVDTQNPTIGALTAQLASSGSVQAVWQASDTNLDTTQATLEYRTPSDSHWQTVPGGSLQVPAAGYAQGKATWQVPPGTEVVWVRLGVRDLAGNIREAGAEARVGATPGAQLASSSYRLPQPTTGPAAGSAIAGNGASSGSPFHALPPPPSNSLASSARVGWSGPGATGMVSNSVAATTPPPAIQHWPSDGESPVPLGSPRSGEVHRLTPPPASVAMSPNRSTTSSMGWSANASPQPTESTASPFQLPQSRPNYPQMRTASAQPFQGAASRGIDTNLQAPDLHRLPSLGSTAQPATGFAGSNNQPAPSAVQHLNSLDFEIGYDVDTAGTYGVTRVELWGTPDGGNSWRRLSVDSDNRSPILATVPAPGDYGLKIVVETAGGIDPVRPRPGDRPEIFVRVDTTPPAAKLTGIRQGTGAEANLLHVEWQRPASLSDDEKATLQYSSTPTGPWATAASNLPNNGRYSWRLARHLPNTFYVRLEVRDLAGNVSSDQTQVPVTINLLSPSGRLGSVRAIQ